jgi:hypothetical protein
MRARRSLVVTIAVAMVLSTGGVATAAEHEGQGGPPAARQRCLDGGGALSTHRGIERCTTTSERVEQGQSVEQGDEVLVSEPDGELRATVRTTTVATTRTTTVVRRIETQRGSLGARGTRSTDRSVEEVGGSTTEVVDEQRTVALAGCELRAGADGWAPAPSTACRDRFGDAVGPTPPFLDPDTAARCELLDPASACSRGRATASRWPTPRPTRDAGWRSTGHRCPATSTAWRSTRPSSTAATASAPAR